MHPAVHRAQDAIARDPARLWTLAALAKAAHVSPRHLSRLFTEHTGIGVVAYQQQLRIARAKQLLASMPTLSMERVADKCGLARREFFGACGSGLRKVRRWMGEKLSDRTPNSACKGTS
jgi:transcriptional regulator GlxA family with amidase domain